MSFLIRLAMNSIFIMVFAQLFPQGVTVDSWTTAIVAAFILAILDAVVKPILTILSLPITILSLGFFQLVVNALVLELGSAMVRGFDIASFGWAFIIAILLSLGNVWITASARDENMRVY